MKYPSAYDFFHQLERSTPSVEYLDYDQASHNFVDIRCPIEKAIPQGKGFLHANKIPFGSRSYIATQAPLNSSAANFWLVAFRESSTIVDLTGDDEIEAYYPEDVGKTKDYNQVNVTLISEVGNKDISTCIYKIASNGAKKTITRIHYKCWKDHDGCSITKLRDLLKKLESIDHLLVHCHAGVGRTGTFITARELLLQGLNSPKKIEELILHGRRFRGPFYVQTPAQISTLFTLAQSKIKECPPISS